MRIRFGNNEPEEESEDLLNLTSMIDVVFTLLAFFIITVRVFGVERDAAIGAAGKAGGQVAQLEKGDLPDAVMIRLVESPSAATKLAIEIGGQHFEDPAAITRQLSEINLPEVPVVFASSPNLTVEQVTGAVDAALQSPMKKVSLRALTNEEMPR